MVHKLNIIATIKCKPGTHLDVIAAIEECVAPTRSEEGCEVYNFYADLEVTGKFVFIETWINKEAHNKHVTLPHFIQMVEKLKPLMVGGFDVQMLEQVL